MCTSSFRASDKRAALDFEARDRAHLARNDDLRHVGIDVL
jgi:hypothetical protein